MQPEKILKSDVLDILFENRNKAYGAYTLRREYNARLYKAIAITFTLAALLLLFSFDSKKTMDGGYVFKNDSIFINHIKPPVTHKVDPPAAKKSNPIRSVAATTPIIPTRPLIVPNEDVTKLIPKNDDINKVNPGLVASQPGSGPNIPGGSGTGGGNDSSGSGTFQNKINKETVIDNPDIPAEYPGGKAALKRFLERNLENPSSENDEQASVLVKFTVKYDGTVSDFEVMQSGGEDFDKEVLRVLRKMPHWIPGKTNGQDVSVHYVIPVRFLVN